MPINPMMYRVFLQDEKDAFSPSHNPENSYRVCHGELLAWTQKTGNYIPSLEEQLKKMHFGSRFEPYRELLDGHILIVYDKISPVAIAHPGDNISDLAYQKAKERAQGLTASLSNLNKTPFTFIDLTSRGDRELAKKLSEIIVQVEVESY
ncbi:MAG: hypothetical protein WC413_00850 [Candidatus Nanoarchaeia archaeon]